MKIDDKIKALAHELDIARRLREKFGPDLKWSSSPYVWTWETAEEPTPERDKLVEHAQIADLGVGMCAVAYLAPKTLEPRANGMRRSGDVTIVLGGPVSIDLIIFHERYAGVAAALVKLSSAERIGDFDDEIPF